MKFKIYGRKYEVDQNLVTTTRVMIQQFLDKIATQAELRKIPQFYTATVVMMFVTSASILKNLNVQDLKELTRDGRSKTGKDEEKREEPDDEEG